MNVCDIFYFKGIKAAGEGGEREGEGARRRGGGAEGEELEGRRRKGKERRKEG